MLSERYWNEKTLITHCDGHGATAAAGIDETWNVYIKYPDTTPNHLPSLLEQIRIESRSLYVIFDISISARFPGAFINAVNEFGRKCKEVDSHLLFMDHHPITLKLADAFKVSYILTPSSYDLTYTFTHNPIASIVGAISDRDTSIKMNAVVRRLLPVADGLDYLTRHFPQKAIELVMNNKWSDIEEYACRNPIREYSKRFIDFAEKNQNVVVINAVGFPFTPVVSPYKIIEKIIEAYNVPIGIMVWVTKSNKPVVFIAKHWLSGGKTLYELLRMNGKKNVLRREYASVRHAIRSAYSFMRKINNALFVQQTIGD